MTEEVLLGGHTGKINKNGELHFSVFPAYAQFIRDNHLIPYIKEQISISKEIDLPMLKFFASMTDEELITMSIPSHTATLTAIAENRIKEQIETGLKSWVENRLPIIDRDQVLADDITLASYVRKQGLLKFIPSYTNDINEILQLVKEIDTYSTETDTAATNVYIELLKGRLHEQDQQLVKSEKLLLQAQTISHTGNWTWDMDTKSLTWSDEIYRIYGLEPQSLETSETVALYNHPDDVETLNEALRQAVKTDLPFDIHYRIVLKDGIKTLHARGEVVRDKENKSFRIYGTLQDVTSQKEAEKQLKEYQEFIQKIADTAPSIIASYNIKTGKYNFISKGLEKILGYDPKEVINDGVAFFMGIIHPDDIGPLMEKNGQILEKANQQKDVDDTEIVAEFKYRMLHKNGTYRWFHTFGTIFNRDSNNEVEQLLNISIDVTEQETAEQALFQKNIQLQQSNLSLEEYAYVASHDLKEPLRKIATFSDRLLNQQESTLNQEGKTYLGKIITSSKRMQTMISDLLSISMLSGQKKYEVTDLNKIFDEALQTLEHQIEEQGAKIEASGLPTANVIPSQFRQLFQNLIGNSLKFTGNSTKPHITITHKFLKPQDVSAYEVAKAKKYLQLTFADNGIGFDNQYAAKIFTIFQRLHGKTEYEGNGIGLSICRKIAENHGGTIYASGIPNKGANFTIIIPV